LPAKEDGQVEISSDEAIMVVQAIKDVIKYEKRINKISDALETDYAIENGDLESEDDSEVESDDSEEEQAEMSKFMKAVAQKYKDLNVPEQLRGIEEFERKCFVTKLQQELVAKDKSLVTKVMTSIGRKLTDDQRALVREALTQMEKPVEVAADSDKNKVAGSVPEKTAKEIKPEVIKVWEVLSDAWNYTSIGNWNTYVRYPIIYQYMWKPVRALWDYKWTLAALAVTAYISYNKGLSAQIPTDSQPTSPAPTPAPEVPAVQPTPVVQPTVATIPTTPVAPAPVSASGIKVSMSAKPVR